MHFSNKLDILILFQRKIKIEKELKFDPKMPPFLYLTVIVMQPKLFLKAVYHKLNVVSVEHDDGWLAGLTQHGHQEVL